MRRSLVTVLLAGGAMAAAVLCMAAGSPDGASCRAGAGEGSAKPAGARQASIQSGDPSAANEALTGWAPRERPGAESSVPETTASLQYYGGPVVSNVVAVSVLWGSGVNADVAAALRSFLRDVTNSSYMDWLCEYDTLGLSGATSNQVIGRGSFAGQFRITPQHTGTTVSDSDIQSEIVYQLQQGTLPQPQFDAQGYPDTLYLIDFPPGITIVDPSGAMSCQQFCAYHGTMMVAGKPLLYTVQPDLGGACAGGCGSGSLLQNQESVHSHQLIEAVTDPDVGLATTFGPPLGWYDPQGQDGEIGDICNSQQATLGVNGAAYTVQRDWSNRLNACVIGDPSLPPGPTISGPASVPVGGTLALTAAGGTAPYEWEFDPGTGQQLIAGQTAATLTLSPVSLSESGSYFVFSRGSCTLESAARAVRVCPPITLAPAQLPGPVPGIAYSQTLTASGGSAPYAFAVTSGALPAGLSLSPAGVLSGTPSSGASASFTVTATDSVGCAGSRSYALQAVTPPSVSSIVKRGGPFRFIASGNNLQDGIKVFIDGAQWSAVTWKSTSKVILHGGSSLKAAVPKGTAVTFVFQNPDGGVATVPGWSW